MPSSSRGVLDAVFGAGLAADRPDAFASAGRLEGVPSAVAAAGDAIDALLRDRGLRVPADAATESTVRGAMFAGWLAGSESEMDALDADHLDEQGGRALRLYARMFEVLPMLNGSPLGAFARLHALASAGGPDEQVGRPKDAEATAFLGGLSARLLGVTSAPAVVVAALTHAEMRVARPFAEGNELVACALERLILFSRGVDPRAVLVPEAGHWRMRGEEAAALHAYAAGTPAGVREWLAHSMRVLGVAVAASPLTCERRPRREDAAHSDGGTR